MAKIRSLLNLLKKLFVSDAKASSEKREKKRRWIHGRFKRKRLPALAAPPEVKERRLTEAEIAQSSHALTTAIATAAAAEAAVASAQAAVEVVRLTGTPWLYLKPMKRSRTSAALKIQTAFRGYLARKALRALKGLVRLQAMVRGQAVRRQVIATLNGLQTVVKMQSQFRVPKNSVGDRQLIKNFDELGEKKTRPELNSQRGKADTLPSKEDTDALDRREALIKRERINEYLLSHRGRRTSMKFRDSEADIASGIPSQWLGQWADGQECKGRITEKSDLLVFCKPEQRNIEVRIGLGLGDFKCHEPLVGRRSPVTPPRRSFDRPRRSSLEDSDSLGSPAPNYMSPTESAKSRLRSISLPKQGQGSLDIYSDHGSPAKNRFSFSSISTDASSTVRGSKGPSSQQRSPSLKGHLGPIKSHRTAKDLSVDSDSSFLSWVQHNSFK